ncbi:MAG TPA: hypothetical protein VNW47_11725 [Terriglobales bacterium]|jgi:hypothetical protein|nr:hypothetical protein [Terriglobales bacterium]
MKRSVGVTTIAILDLLGSAVMLLMAAFMMVIPFLVPMFKTSQFPGSPTAFKSLMLISALIYVLPAAWGIATAIGLFRLKEWARISIIVFSVLLILTGACMGLGIVVFFTPPAASPAPDPTVMEGVRWFMGGFSFLLLSIGIWWLVFFTRPRVNQQFATVPAALGATPSPAILQPGSPIIPVAPPAARRPLSITIIAWFLLVGCLFIPLNFFLHTPAILFTKIVTGWAAVLYFVTFAALSLYIGVGLLRLKPSARTVGVTYYGFFIVNLAVFYFAPGASSRMADLMQRSQALFPWAPQQQSSLLFDPTRLLLMGASIGLISLALPLYFLVTRKQAFEKAGLSPTV